MRITDSKVVLRLVELDEGRLPVLGVERTLRGHLERYIVNGVRLVVVTGQHNRSRTVAQDVVAWFVSYPASEIASDELQIQTSHHTTKDQI